MSRVKDRRRELLVADGWHQVWEVTGRKFGEFWTKGNKKLRLGAAWKIYEKSH